MTLVFVEMKGQEARARLIALKSELETSAGCRAARLLESEDEPGLFLLEVAWRGEALPALQESLPEGSKVWRFRQAW